MKVKTRIPFFDKVAKKARKKDEVFDCTPARFAEITQKGKFVEPVEDQKPVKG